MFEVVDLDSGQVKVAADELAEGVHVLFLVELAHLVLTALPKIRVPAGEDVDQVEGAESWGVGAYEVVESAVVCDPAFEFEGAEVWEVQGCDEGVEGL